MIEIGLSHYLTVAAICSRWACSAFSEPEERHHHPDVGRTDPAGREHQSGGVLDPSQRLAGQVFALLVLAIAAAEAAIGLAVIVVYFRNRGSIAVEDINLMKG